MSDYQIEHIHITDLRRWARNSRTHSEEQVAQIAKSIREFGWTNPVLIDRENNIVAGHGRIMAAETLGIHVVPCLRLEHLDDEQVRAYVVADNQLALQAGWDMDILRGELLDLREVGFDLDLIGFDDEELNTIFSGEASSKDSDGTPDEYRLTVWSKDEAEILALKKLIGVSASEGKVAAHRVIGMVQG